MKVLKGNTVEEKLDSADIELDRISRKLNVGVKPQAISPFLLTAYIEGQKELFAYIPVQCTFEAVDLAVDSISVPTGEKAIATVSIKVSTLNEGSFSYEDIIKVGHYNKSINKVIKSPAKVTVSFDKPTYAWLCLVAYPLMPKIIMVEEG